MEKVHLWQKSIQFPHRSGLQLHVVALLLDGVHAGLVLWSLEKYLGIRGGCSHERAPYIAAILTLSFLAEP